MRSSKQWHKCLLFSCVALAFLAGAAFAEPTGYRWGGTYVLNAFTPVESDDYLTGVSFWTEAEQSNLNYELAVYHNFAFDDNLGYGSVSNLASWMSGSLVGTGEHTVTLPSVVLIADKDYYVVLGLSGVSEPLYGWVAGETGFFSNDYVFRGTGGTWPNQGVTWAITPITTDQGPDANIAVTANAGNWTVDDTFVSPATMTATVDATDLGPHDVEVTVTGGMDPITIDDTITNSTSADWDGFGIQLGYGLGEEFVLATDGLSFVGLGTNQFVSLDPIAAGDDGSATFGINMGLSSVFTARMFAIPEPTSFMLLAFSGLALLALGRRRR